VQAALDQRDGDVCDVDPDPPPAELLRRGDCRAAAAEGVKDGVASLLLALMIRSNSACGFCVG
jgi:hypothetical protein